MASLLEMKTNTDVNEAIGGQAQQQPLGTDILNALGNKAGEDNLSLDYLGGNRITQGDVISNLRDLRLVQEYARRSKASNLEKSLGLAPTTEDWYPNRDNITAGYYEGDIIGHVPIFTPGNVLFPIGAYSKRKMMLQLAALQEPEDVAMQYKVPELEKQAANYQQWYSDAYVKGMNNWIDLANRIDPKMGVKLLQDSRSSLYQRFKLWESNMISAEKQINNITTVATEMMKVEADGKIHVPKAVKNRLNNILSANQQLLDGYLASDGVNIAEEQKNLDTDYQILNAVQDMWRSKMTDLRTTISKRPDLVEAAGGDIALAIEKYAHEFLTPEDLEGLTRSIAVSFPDEVWDNSTPGTRRKEDQDWSYNDVKSMFESLAGEKITRDIQTVSSGGAGSTAKAKVSGFTQYVNDVVSEANTTGTFKTEDDIVLGGNAVQVFYDKANNTLTMLPNTDTKGIGKQVARMAAKKGERAGITAEFSQGDASNAVDANLNNIQASIGLMTNRYYDAARLNYPTDKSDKNVVDKVNAITDLAGGLVATSPNKDVGFIVIKSAVKDGNSYQYTADFGATSNVNGVMIPSATWQSAYPEVANQLGMGISLSSSLSPYLPVSGGYTFIPGAKILDKGNGVYTLDISGSPVTGVPANYAASKTIKLSADQVFGAINGYYKSVVETTKRGLQGNTTTQQTVGQSTGTAPSGKYDYIRTMSRVPQMQNLKSRYNPNTGMFVDDNLNTIVRMASVMVSENPNYTYESAYNDAASIWAITNGLVDADEKTMKEATEIFNSYIPDISKITVKSVADKYLFK